MTHKSPKCITPSHHLHPIMPSQQHLFVVLTALLGLLVLFASGSPGRRDSKALASRCPYGARQRYNEVSFKRLVEEQGLDFIGCITKVRRGKSISMRCSAGCNNGTLDFSTLVNKAITQNSITSECTLSRKRKRYRTWRQIWQARANDFGSAYCAQLQ